MVDEVGGVSVSRETMGRLATYVRILLDENDRQNLISRTTVASVWERHIADSAQLVTLAPANATWADVGSGAGLPGIVAAIITQCPTRLIEPRRLRIEFLDRVKREAGLDNVTIFQGKAQNADGKFDIITARAVASASQLLTFSSHLAHDRTKYLLMKGRSAQSELEELRMTWQGNFVLVPSRTDADAAILVAEQARRRGRK
jgi:16S rRNA (guanine527-N7)-methyltransferase